MSNENSADSGAFPVQTGRYALAGEGVSIGHDSGDAVSAGYKPKFPFAGGRIIKVVYDVASESTLVSNGGLPRS